MANRFKIGNKFIGPNEPVFIIAEIGQNHQGDINLAKQLIKHAKVRTRKLFISNNKNQIVFVSVSVGI